MGKNPRTGEHLLPGVGCKRLNGAIRASMGTSTPALGPAGMEWGAPQGLPWGLTLADSWDVSVATFSCEDSSSRRSLRICCGERAEMRGASTALTGAGAGVSKGCGLTSDCIFSSAWQHESREEQTDRGRQSGGQRGTDRLSSRQRHAQSPPQSHPDPPAMHKAAQQHGGGSYGGVGGGRTGGQGQHRSVNCNTGKPELSGCPGEQHPGATVRAHLLTGLSGGAWGRYRVGWQLLSTAHFSVHALHMHPPLWGTQGLCCPSCLLGSPPPQCHSTLGATQGH